MSVKFSITIPAYKIRFLQKAIESCLNQTYQNFELIVVDDASPDDIKSVVDSFNDSRVRYFRNVTNCGAYDVVDNWNICLGYCTGDYVICMGDDDMLVSNCLEEYTYLMEKYPGLGVYHARTDVIDEEGNIIDHQRKRPEFQSCLELVLCRWQWDIQFIGDFCFDVGMLRKEGGYHKLPLAWASDDITSVRAAEYRGIANTQTSTFLYRSNSQSITNSKASVIKLHATCMEREWYSSFLDRQKDKILKDGTDKERKVLDELISHVFKYYFNTQINRYLAQSFEESLWNIFPSLAMIGQMKSSPIKIIRLWYRAVKTYVRK